MSKKLLLSVGIFLAELSKLHFSCPKQHFDEEHFFLKGFLKLTSFVDLDKGNFFCFVPNFSAGLSILHFACPQKPCEAIFCSEELCFL